MTEKTLNVVQLRDFNLRDVTDQMRSLADRIDAGEYGQVGCAGFVLLGDTFECFGWGDGVHSESNSPSVFLLFQAAVQRMGAEIEGHGR